MSRTGYVGVGSVDEMVATIKNHNYDKVILISERFTKAAEKKMEEESTKLYEALVPVGVSWEQYERFWQMIEEEERNRPPGDKQYRCYLFPKWLI